MRRAAGPAPGLACVAGAALLAACAGAPLAPPEADAQARLLQPPEGRALIYVCRPSLMAALSAFTFYADAELVGELGVLTFYVLEVEPGPHVIAFPWGFGAATLRVQAEAGRRYFVRQWVEHFSADAIRLEEVDEEEGLRALGRLVRVVRLRPLRDEDRLARDLQPPEGRALVYVFRRSWAGIGADIELDVGDRPAGRLAVRTFVVAEVAPGEVLVKARGENEARLTLRLWPGSVAYVAVLPRTGWTKPKVELRQVDQGPGKASVAELFLAARPGP